MNGQPQIGGVDHQIGRARRHGRGLHLLGQPLRDPAQLRMPIPHTVRAGDIFPAAPDRRRQRPHGLERAGRGIDRDRLQLRLQAHPLLDDRRTRGVGVVGLFLHLQQGRGDVIDAVGGR